MEIACDMATDVLKVLGFFKLAASAPNETKLYKRVLPGLFCMMHVRSDIFRGPSREPLGPL